MLTPNIQIEQNLTKFLILCIRNQKQIIWNRLSDYVKFNLSVTEELIKYAIINKKLVFISWW
jgi:hypothetical protein